MHVEPTAIGRLRAREVSPATFRKLSMASAAGFSLVVTTGAVVRLTGSGLGCEHWPRCGATPVPTEASGGHSIIEFSNRVVALAAVGLALAAWIAARRTPGVDCGVRRLAATVFVGSFLEIPMGGLVIVTGLSAGLVMAHFLLAVAMLGLAVAVANEALRADLGASPPLVPAFLRRAGIVLAVAACGLVTTGAFATAS